MSVYIRTIIMEDGFKIEKEDPSLKEDTTVYVLKDSNGKHYILNQDDKIPADLFLLMFRLNYYSFDVPHLYNDTQKNEVYKSVLEQANESTEDVNARKYLKNSIDGVFQTNTIDYENIKAELDKHTTNIVEEFIKEYLAKMIEEENQTALEIKSWLTEYLNKRNEEYNLKSTETLETLETLKTEEEEESMFAGVGRFLKKFALDSISFVGEIVENELLHNLSNAEKILADSKKYDDATVEKAEKFVELFDKTNDAGYTAYDVIDEVKNYVDDVRNSDED